VTHSVRRRWWSWALLRRLTALAFLGLLVLAGRGAVVWFRGTTSATSLAGRIPFTDPLAAVEVSLSSGHWPATVWTGAVLLIALALLLGPVFCGWLCPLGLLLDLNAALRTWVLRVGFRKRAVAVKPWRSRILVLGIFLGLSLVARWPVFQTLSPINLLVRALAFGADGAILIVLLVILGDMIVPRVWCRELCPQGALYGLLGRRAPFRVRVNKQLAGQIRCQRCDVACPMGIRVMEDYTLAGHSSVDHPDCTRCGSCIDVCPRGVLRLGVRHTEGNGRQGAASYPRGRA